MGTPQGTSPAEDDGIDRAIGTALRVLRARRGGMSQRELARRSGLAKNTVFRIENAERSVDVRQLFKLADALEVTPAELLLSAIGELEVKDG